MCVTLGSQFTLASQFTWASQFIVQACRHTPWLIYAMARADTFPSVALLLGRHGHLLSFLGSSDYILFVCFLEASHILSQAEVNGLWWYVIE